MATTYKLEDNAIEKSTYIITISFTDENGDAISPKTLVWTLTDVKNRVINSRSDVSVAAPTASNNIVLSGDDLKLEQNDNRVRLLTAEATYDSVAYGNDLPIKASAKFKIDNLIHVE